MTSARIDELLHMFNHDARIARTFGMRLSFNTEGQAIIDLPYNAGLDHGLGGVHGGVYMTLLDTAAWFTAAAAHADSVWVATAEITVHLLKPAYEVDLRAVGRLIQAGRRLDIAEAHLNTGDGRLIGHAVGTFIVLPDVRTDE